MSKIINIAFIPPVHDGWMGGVNYYKNLFYALKSNDNHDFKIIIFLGKKNFDNKILELYRPYVDMVVMSEIFDKFSFRWFLQRVLQRVLKSNFCFSRLFREYDIDVLSHSQFYNVKGVKTISWIPDFQHLHLPSMFDTKEIEQRNADFNSRIKFSDAVWVSSESALNDLKKFAPDYAEKGRLLRFVSQPIDGYWDIDISEKSVLEKKYNLPNDYYFLPNQFWKHKNHIIVFEAVKKIVEDGGNINVVCSGKLKDYRNQKHIDKLLQYVKDNNLEHNIFMLGLIEYKDVYKLIKFSKSVINPSLFEGWSSTVEECKSVEKRMILSDIDVHLEQYPEALFFKKDDVASLVEVLKEDSMTRPPNTYIKPLSERTRLFAECYFSEVLKIVNS